MLRKAPLRQNAHLPEAGYGLRHRANSNPYEGFRRLLALAFELPTGSMFPQGSKRVGMRSIKAGEASQ